VFIDMHCYTIDAGNGADWSYWALWFRDEKPTAPALAALRDANAAVASVQSDVFTIGIWDRYNPKYGGAGTRSAPRMAALWVHSHFPGVWATTLEHAIFRGKRLEAGQECPVPEDHRQRGPIIGRTVLRHINGRAGDAE
jgi:hypothetical protein